MKQVQIFKWVDVHLVSRYFPATWWRTDHRHSTSSTIATSYTPKISDVYDVWETERERKILNADHASRWICSQNYLANLIGAVGTGACPGESPKFLFGKEERTGRNRKKRRER